MSDRELEAELDNTYRQADRLRRRLADAEQRALLAERALASALQVDEGTVQDVIQAVNKLVGMHPVVDRLLRHVIEQGKRIEALQGQLVQAEIDCAEQYGATCGDCGHTLTLVRPGKHQCDWCELNALYGELEVEHQQLEQQYDRTAALTAWAGEQPMFEADLLNAYLGVRWNDLATVEAVEAEIEAVKAHGIEVARQAAEGKGEG